MNKILTYLRYFYDYLLHGDFRSILASVRYVLFGTSHKTDRIISTAAGTYFCRKNTNDFQLANFYYEWGVRKYLLSHQKKFSVFIDGGACTGSYSLLFAARGKRCIAFEPVSSNYNIINKNLELNKLEHEVVVFPYGLGAANARAGFAFNPVNTGASHKIENMTEADQFVEIRTLDSLMPEMAIGSDERIMIKLDVEGMEVEAIKGAADFIRHYPNITFVIEDKHSGESLIKDALNEIAGFDYGIVDEYNIYAKKTN